MLVFLPAKGDSQDFPTNKVYKILATSVLSIEETGQVNPDESYNFQKERDCSTQYEGAPNVSCNQICG